MANKKKADCTPEEWAAHLEYIRQWRINNIEEQRERKRAYCQRPDVKAKRAAFDASPAAKEKRATRDSTPAAREKSKARQSTSKAKTQRLADQRLRRTGFTDELVRALLDTQKNSCAVCGRQFAEPKLIRADHCHTSGEPRGLLCHPCNIIEGFMSRLPIGPEEFAKRISNYLTNPPARSLK